MGIPRMKSAKIVQILGRQNETIAEQALDSGGVECKMASISSAP